MRCSTLRTRGSVSFSTSYSRSSLATCVWPRMRATCSGVWPEESCAFTCSRANERERAGCGGRRRLKARAHEEGQGQRTREDWRAVAEAGPRRALTRVPDRRSTAALSAAPLAAQECKAVACATAARGVDSTRGGLLGTRRGAAELRWPYLRGVRGVHRRAALQQPLQRRCSPATRVRVAHVFVIKKHTWHKLARKRVHGKR